MHITKKFLVAASVALLSVPAHAADFAFIHDVGGDSISIIGGIYEGDDRAFSSMLAKHPTVDLIAVGSSYGGDFGAALAIAKTIHSKGLYTLAVNSNCNSACSMIWAAGDEAYVLPGNASPRFHLPNTYGTWTVEKSTYLKYTRAVGISDSFVTYVADAAGPSNDSVSIPLSKLKSFGIDAYVLR